MIEGTSFDGATTELADADAVDPLCNSESLETFRAEPVAEGSVAGVTVTLNGFGGLRIVGTDAGDPLTGSSEEDQLFGEGGNDTLNGGGGDDVLVGGLGFDIADYSGGIENYTFSLDAAGNGTVTDNRPGSPDGTDDLTSVEVIRFSNIAYAAGNPRNLLITVNGAGGLNIFGTGSGDVLTGGPGDDFIGGNGGPDTIHGGAGNDSISPGFPTAEPLRAYGDSGGDGLRGGEGNDHLEGGSGDDGLDGYYGDDVLYGGAGNDSLYGDFGDDLIDGGADDDVIYFSGGHDIVNGGDGIDTFVSPYPINDSISFFTGSAGLTFFSTPDFGGSTVSLSSIEIVIAAGQTYSIIDVPLAPPEWILGTAEDDPNLQGTGLADKIDGLGNDDVIHGMQGNDIIYGSSGNDLIYGDLGIDQLFGGSGFDTFVVNGTDFIDGGPDFDTVDLFGGAKDWTVRVSHWGEDWASTSYLVTGPGHAAHLTNVEGLRFDDPVTNPVTPTSDNPSVEMIRLAYEVYGPLPTLSHLAEPLASEPLSVPTQTSGVAARAIARGWHAVSALELGMKPADFGEWGSLEYAFDAGLYQAKYSSASPEVPEANALVLTGVIDGKRTLAIVVRGTDQVADFRDYTTFQNHYDKFAPLIQAIKIWLEGDIGEGSIGPNIEQIYVSGHSLGGGIAQYVMKNLEGLGLPVKGFTDGSPGAEAGAQPTSQLINFINTDDLVPKLGDLSDSDAARVALAAIIPGSGLLTSQIDPKVRSGGAVLIDSDVGSLWWTTEHDATLYVRELAKLAQFANDVDSPFYASALAASLRDTTAFTGTVRIALGEPDVPFDPANPIYAPAVFSTTVNAYGADNFVLGNVGSADTLFVLGGDPVAKNGFRKFDGGGVNPGGIDIVRAPWSQTLYTITTAQDGIGKTLNFLGMPQDGYAAGTVGTLYRINAVLFQDGLVFLNGQTPVVQTAPSNEAKPPGGELADLVAPTFQLLAGFDYAEAGDGDLYVLGTADRDILFVGSGDKVIDMGAGDDVVIVQGALPGDHLTIDGGAGADLMVGGLGIEEFFVDDPGDEVSVDAPGGLHTVHASVSYSLGENIENLTLTGTGANGMGNGLANALVGNSQANTLIGGGGDDTLDGAAGKDDLTGGAGNDILIGGTGFDTARFSGAKADYTITTDVFGVSTITDKRADSPDGTDSLKTIETLLFSDGTSTLGTTVTVAGPDGYDFAWEILASAPVTSYNATTVVIDGGGATITLNGTFTAFDGNDHPTAGTITGITIDDINPLVIATPGFDVGAFNTFLTNNDGQGLIAVLLAGDDTILGGAADDSLAGQGGNDTLVGGTGNDTYAVEDAGDVVTEAGGEGTDTVQTDQGARFDYNALYLLPTNVENLTGTSSGAQGVWANSGDNVVTMGGGNDLIVLADGGADTVSGGGGNDYIYFGGTLTSADNIDGGAGYDTLGLIGSTTLTLTTAMINLERMAVYSAVYFGGGAFDYSITTVDANIGAAGMFVTAASLQATEHLTFDASAESSGGITVHGGAGDDVISTGAGADFLIGNAGADVLTGNGGADTLLGGAGADTFVYRATSDSTVSTMDNISGFATGDHIDLSTIDAITGGANDAFTFIGTAAFSQVAGQARAFNTSGSTWQVQADVDGDGVADLVILVGVGDGQPLGAGSFVL